MEVFLSVYRWRDKRSYQKFLDVNGINFLLPSFETCLNGCVTALKLSRKSEGSAGVVARGFAVLHVWPNVEVSILHRINLQHDEEVFVGFLDYLKLGKWLQRREV